MGTKPLLPILVTSIMLSGSFAEAQGDNPAPAVQNDLGIGNTSVGEKSDVGTSDPLSVVEDEKAGSSAAEPPAPEFKEIESSGADATSTESSNAESPTPEPETPQAETSEPPAPVASPEPEVPAQADSPNFNRERAFHRIYKKYNEQPTPLEAWEQVAATRISQNYKVQNGDTLWDLSRTLFGDPNYWPKVWALNKDEVLNPHEIDTWMQIRFFPGSLNEPPSLAVNEAPKVAEATMENGEPSEAEVEIPPSLRPKRPLIKKLPDSLPLYRYETVNTPPLDFTAVAPFRAIPRPAVPLQYYASDREVGGVGTVKETELGGKTASEYQYVFIETSSPEKIFTVVRDIGPIKDLNGDETSGRLIEVQGEIEVIDRVAERGNMFRAIVRRNLTPIEIGGALIPGAIERVPTADGPAVTGPQVTLIGAQYSSDRKLVDADGFVFLNGGTDKGLSVGMILPVTADAKVRNPNSEIHYGDRQVGRVRIVKVGKRFSTAYLTKIADDIYIGDIVGGSPGLKASPIPAGKENEESEGDLDIGDEPMEESAAPAAPADSGAATDGDLEFGDDSFDEPAAVEATPSPGAPPEPEAPKEEELNLEDEGELSL